MIDGLCDDALRKACTYLISAVANGEARRWTLPTISAPLYETLHTGRTLTEHGLLKNGNTRPSRDPSVFSEAKAAGGTSPEVGQCYSTRFLAALSLILSSMSKKTTPTPLLASRMGMMIAESKPLGATGASPSGASEDQRAFLAEGKSIKASDE
ncbi:MAG: hypothetical protein AAF330_07615, partial [Pseudomonadota bacterium]